MKKIICFLLAVLMMFTLFACGDDTSDTSAPVSEIIVEEAPVTSVVEESISIIEESVIKEEIPMSDVIEERASAVEEPINDFVPSVETQIVYITPTGNKYHKITCHHIEDSEITNMTINEAITSGYDPCGTCNP